MRKMLAEVRYSAKQLLQDERLRVWSEVAFLEL